MDLKLSLTASIILSQNKQSHHQSKEQFFCIKKSSRRNKCSKLIEQETPLDKSPQINPNYNQCQFMMRLQNLELKELHYSLAETEDPDVLLEFKTVQPKKKKLPSRIYSTAVDDRSATDNEQLVSQLNKLGRIGKTNNPTKVQHQHKRQKQNINQFCNSQKLEQNKQKITLSESKQQISKTITTLFSNKVALVQQRQQLHLSINDFHVIKQVGQGTYSKVYQVSYKKSGFLCALKILQKKLIKQLKVQQNSIRQIKILSCLSAHPNITTLYGSFTDQKYIYLILELCTDGDVNQNFKRIREIQRNCDVKGKQKRIQMQQKHMVQTVHILRQICLALKQLHQHSIMHRDIKPENILITMGNNVKMSDFGWSVHNPKDKLRKTLCGTPLYLAPQFITTCRYNDSIDIWSLGVMAYQLFAHQFPFKIQSVNDLVKIVEQQINFEKIKCPVARDFCSKALVKDRHYRADVWELLQHEIFNIYQNPE